MSTVHCRDAIDMERELERVECVISSYPPSNTVAVVNNAASLLVASSPLVSRVEVIGKSFMNPIKLSSLILIG